MKNGFLRAGTAAPNIRVADPDYNAERIIEIIKEAAGSGAELLVFPELCLTGYTCGDLFTQSVLIKSAENALKRIAEATLKTDTLVFVGLPVFYRDKLYDCAAAVKGGKVVGVIPKVKLSIGEMRHFAVYAGETVDINIAGHKCRFGTDFLLVDDSGEVTVGVEMGDVLICEPHAALVTVNLSADSEGVGKAAMRKTLALAKTSTGTSALIYACAGRGESTTDLVFSGYGIIAENGKVLRERKPFCGENLTLADIDVDYLRFERKKRPERKGACGNIIPALTVSSRGGNLMREVGRTPFVPESEDELELVLEIQSEGLRKRMEHIGARKLVLGVSGGLDSALALLVCVRTLDLLGKPHTDLEAVSMPCFGTSGRTAENAQLLSKAVGASYRIVDIKGSVTAHLKEIGHDLSTHDSAYENAQARMRTMVLMDIANACGGIVVGTGDLSEEALGWCTYNGDHMSMYGVNASVPKTLVKRLVRKEANRIGGKAEKALIDILATEISPELLPAENGKITQKTEDIIGSYELNDFFLYYAIIRGCTPEKTLTYASKAFGVSEESNVEALKRFYKRFFAAQFKRSCCPDGVKTEYSLSPRGDLVMPSDACVNAWLKSLEK